MIRAPWMNIYNALPVAAQNVACSLEGWRILRDRFNGEFKRILREYEVRAEWDQAHICEFRDSRLRAFVAACWEQSPFYRGKLEAAGVHPSDIRTLTDLAAVPVSTKAEVKSNYGDIVSRHIGSRQIRPAHTSGTTGSGFTFASTATAIREQWAVWWRYRRWHGIDLNSWCGYFGGRSVVPAGAPEAPYWRYNLPGRQILFSAYHIHRGALAAYVSELRRRRPAWLHGYPSVLALLAAYLCDTNSDLGYAVRWITTGAETLLPHQRELIRRAFGVTPRQHYGMAEAVANISECEEGSLHVDEDFAAVEFLPVRDTWKVVGTNFTNLATPLIRYEALDEVTLAKGGCACGRPGRLVAAIDGRVEDYVLLPNGARLGRLDHIFKDLVNIKEAQIYQRNIGQVVIRVVRGGAYCKADEERLIGEMALRVGRDTSVRIDYVAALERSRTGKLRFVISEVDEASIYHAWI